MANNEDAYKVELCRIATAAAKAEETWLAASEENIGKLEVFKSMDIKGGGYRAMGWNQSTYTDSPRAACRRCGHTGSIERKTVRAGCRMNGDAYGSLVSMCGHCGLLLWRSYDEA